MGVSCDGDSTIETAASTSVAELPVLRPAGRPRASQRLEQRGEAPLRLERASDDGVQAAEQHGREANKARERLEHELAQRDALLEEQRREISQLQARLEVQQALLDAAQERIAALESAPPVLAADEPSMAARIAELEHDLRAAEDQIHDLEGELRRVRGLSSPPALEAEPAAEPPREEFAAEGPARFLALIDGDTEIVHRLGRRTTIGRAADNDIRIDARFVSRHHATVLAGPHQTIIEDLGSTNGLIVNGRRVSRHVLRDGDVVRVGLSRFRFLTRSR
ncbi:MAG: FHA domain-containing protein [Steroidobacteraceae bacterium]|nr:FHA domain-containing protein [Steroidobacteraceae bacterium]MDW8258497.1 FHA domain-containing protein [Gammaproteobacteria bacterium]